MSEISQISRPLTVYESYPTVKNTEVREAYAREGQNSEEIDKIKEAYQSNDSYSREASQDQHVKESREVLAYEMKNGNMQTSTSFSTPPPSVSWLA